MINILLLILAALALAGQLADCITSYNGIFVHHIAVEGDRSSFTQWCARAGWRTLFVKPAMVLFVDFIFAWAVPRWMPGLTADKGLIYLAEFVGFVIMGAAAATGFNAGWHNHQINVKAEQSK
jgi:hypothetical protein